MSQGASDGRRDTPPQAPERDRLERLASLLDDRFRIPGTNWRFGIDPILGLLPGLGDAIAAAFALVIMWEAYRCGAPAPLLSRMAGNLFLDTVVGSVPVVGNIFDIAWKANRRNLRLLRKWQAEQRHPRAHTGPRG